jgi:putative membrane protein
MTNTVKYLGLLASVMIYLLSSCNNGSSDSVKNAKDSNAARIDSQRTVERPADSMATLPPKADANFLVDAANGGMMEVRLGQMAQTRASNRRVRDFGEMMDREHGEGNIKLKNLAAARKVILPDTISNHDQKEMEALQKKTGLNFDRAYINRMVQDHKDDIKEFEKEATKGTDTQIRDFANSNLAMLRKHLDSAENLQKLLGISDVKVLPAMPPR